MVVVDVNIVDVAALPVVVVMVSWRVWTIHVERNQYFAERK